MSSKPPEAPAPADGAAPAPKSGPPVAIVAAVVCVVLLGAGFALSFFVLPGKIVAQLKAELEAPSDAGDPPKDGAHGAGEKAPEAAKADGAEGHGEAKPEEAGAKAEPAKAEAAKEFTIENLVVNISGSRAGRFVRVSIAFEAEPEVLTELAAQRPRVIDLVGSTLAGKSEDELRAPTARGVLRSEIVNAVNPILQKGQIKAVFFLEYLIQP